MLLGCIGDDFTGSSDLGNTLAKQGMRTVQYVGVPDGSAGADVEAGVVALKSRSIPVRDAVDQSLAALEWLQAQGCEQFFFKYCSTFDSTREGNIGPVAEALAERLGAGKVIFCPAFPGTGRSIYQGHLFVGDKLLSESGMENHPLTPMVDADIRRWLSHQTKGSVGHITAATVFAGADAVRSGLSDSEAAGHNLIVVDALRDEDLMVIGEAVDGLPLVTGGSGVALGLPENFRKAGRLAGGGVQWRGEAGRCAILSGSCSNATRGQIMEHAKAHPTLELDAAKVINGDTTADDVATWVMQQDGLPLVYSSAEPSAVKAVQEEFGLEKSATAFENLFGAIARALIAAGVNRLITAGGETSGAVVEALAPSQLEIGPEIDPGVPAFRANSELVLALKSGNFGGPDFFAKAATVLAGDA